MAEPTSPGGESPRTKLTDDAGSDAVMMRAHTPPIGYRLILRGELGDQYASLFDGMHITRESGTTVLSGRVRDQSHLAGILESAQELGLEIISLSQWDAEP
ncbi:hypothetical protein [Microbacterium sp. LWH3-1.2]|uniref:hypothetical protein n=1 Tax=Microbacterium sp. LWH3-1.2 TaxID=3135256 RepID=UPI00342117B1